MNQKQHCALKDHLTSEHQQQICLQDFFQSNSIFPLQQKVFLKALSPNTPIRNMLSSLFQMNQFIVSTDMYQRLSHQHTNNKRISQTLPLFHQSICIFAKSCEQIFATSTSITICSEKSVMYEPFLHTNNHQEYQATRPAVTRNCFEVDLNQGIMIMSTSLPQHRHDRSSRLTWFLNIILILPHRKPLYSHNMR